MPRNDIVKAKDNLLIDDKIYNLDNLVAAVGKTIFFNKDNKNIDIYGKVNNHYKTIDCLDLLMTNIEL